MIADEILKLLPIKKAAWLRTEILASTVLKVQNVADYFYVGTEQENWELKEFPCIAPTWPLIWMEYITPASIHSEGRRISAPRVTWGCLMRAMDVNHPFFAQYMSALANARKNTRILDGGLWLEPGNWIVPTADAKWFVELHVFCPWMAAIGRDQDVGTLTYWVDNGGEPIEARPRMFGLITGQPDNLLEEMFAIITSGPRLIAWLALSLSHCKNIAVERHEIAAALVKRRGERGHLPVSYNYTLNIKSFLQSQSANAPHGMTNAERAMHFCRGHFKKYTETNPLFGKHTGTYWWPMHVRGDAAHGTVGKSYIVGGHG